MRYAVMIALALSCAILVTACYERTERTDAGKLSPASTQQLTVPVALAPDTTLARADTVYVRLAVPELSADFNTYEAVYSWDAAKLRHIGCASGWQFETCRAEEGSLFPDAAEGRVVNGVACSTFYWKRDYYTGTGTDSLKVVGAILCANTSAHGPGLLNRVPFELLTESGSAEVRLVRARAMLAGFSVPVSIAAGADAAQLSWGASRASHADPQDWSPEP